MSNFETGRRRTTGCSRGVSAETAIARQPSRESFAVGLRLARRRIRGCSTWRDALKILKIAAAVGALAAASTITAVALDISGAGATFPYPIYAKWADSYKKETGNGLNYQSIGSGGGIKQIQAKTVTFGASDMPLKPEDLKKDGLIQFPTVIGGDIPVVNLEGIKPGDLKLDGPTLAKIFLGEIKTWNDAAIQKLNPSAKLRLQPIVVVHRSDGSGTTFIWTDYLSKVSADWKSKVGANTSVEWPVGIGAKGNEGVANNVGNTKGSIGYVEYAYAKQNKLTFTKMVNKTGKTVSPTSEAFQAAAANADWKSQPGYGVILANQPGDQSWPMTAATWILLYKTPSDPVATGEALKFFSWSYAKGADMAKGLDYVPMPGNVVSDIQKMWATDIKDASGKPLFGMTH
jgi:phosphate transport system substrate-binding protein